MKDSRPGWGERTGADVASLLVELGRVWKAASFYGAEAPPTAGLADRAARAWQSDLARAGPLELEVSGRGFRVDGLPGLYGTEHLAAVAAGLSALGVQRIRFTEVLSSASLTAFVAALCRLDEERPASQLGIEVNGEICWVLGSEPPVDAPAAAVGLSADSLGGTLLGSRHMPPPQPGSSDLEPDPDELEAPEKSEDEAHLPTATGPDGAGLLQILQEIERCADDDGYRQLADRVAGAARALSEEGLDEEAHRALLLLADHAVGEGGRSAVQARLARSTLVELATGTRLAGLIDRACAKDTKVGVRAAQVLLTLGEHAVPALFERLERERDSGRAAQLTGLLIAIGEAAVPTLGAAMESGPGRRARLAIQLAGDLQCPAFVRPLRALLCARQGELQRDAARALVEMGNSAALRVLLEALESRTDRVAEIAAFSLGTLASPRSLPALVRRLERATDERRWSLVREVLQALAQFHEADRATARALVTWIQRGGPPWRRPDLDLKLEAVTTLGQLGGRHTTDALREIAGLPVPTRLRERAERILDRRGDGRLTPR